MQFLRSGYKTNTWWEDGAGAVRRVEDKEASGA